MHGNLRSDVASDDGLCQRKSHFMRFCTFASHALTRFRLTAVVPHAAHLTAVLKEALADANRVASVAMRGGAAADEHAHGDDNVAGLPSNVEDAGMDL